MIRLPPRSTLFPDTTVFRSVRKLGVPPRYSSTVVARGFEASILPQRVLYSARVMSLVQHWAEAALPVAGSAGENCWGHLAEVGRAHSLTPLTPITRMPAYAC